MVIVILILFFCGAMLLLDRMLCGFIEKVSNSKKMKKMNVIILFLLLCALGSLCYWFYFKCVDWFEKI